MDAMVPVLITTYSPFPTLSLSLPRSFNTSELSRVLEPICPIEQQSLSTLSGRSLARYPTIDSLCTSTTSTDHDSGPVTLRLAVRIRGGKGGFASQLRAQGGRMTSNRATNKDSCRDLSGRRLSTVKEAEKLAKYLAAEPDRKAAKAKEAAERLEKLQNEIKRLDEQINGDSSNAGAAAASSSKRKLDDHEFVEQSREMVANVKDAVKEAMMRKRKKAKIDNNATDAKDSTTKKPAATSSKTLSAAA